MNNQKLVSSTFDTVTNSDPNSTSNIMAQQTISDDTIYFEKITEDIVSKGLQNVPSDSVTNPQIVANIILTSLNNYNPSPNQQSLINNIPPDQQTSITFKAIGLCLGIFIKDRWTTNQINNGYNQFLKQTVDTIIQLMKQQSTTQPTTQPTSQSSTSQSSTSHKTLYIILGIVLVLLICGGGVFMYMRSHKK